MDDPSLLRPEWDRKGAKEALARYYDEIWVYGLETVYRPLAGLGLPAEIERRTSYTGYIRRDLPQASALPPFPELTNSPFILVTTGGGGDGDQVVDSVIAAYEAAPDLETPALVVFGPFINRDRRRSFLERIARHPKLDALAFDTKLELLMQKAAGVVAMGGYNTFCEILSFDKRALIVPRTRPRREQLIRAVAAERLGLVKTLLEEDRSPDPGRMAEALKGLAGQSLPSEVVIPGLLDGLDLIRGRVAGHLAGARAPVPLHHAAE
jgi:predicted glycosyltransferase